MSEKDLIFQSNTGVLPTPSEPFTKRAKAFKVTSSSANFRQYQRTVRAYMEAGLPFEHIANAGESLRDPVERQELDASFLNELQNKAGEIAEDENNIIAWQDRGERISVTAQLPQSSIQGTEVVPISSDLTQTQEPGIQERGVIEGIGVFTKSSDKLEDNPYLKPIQDSKPVPDFLKKAA